MGPPLAYSHPGFLGHFGSISVVQVCEGAGDLESQLRNELFVGKTMSGSKYCGGGGGGDDGGRPRLKGSLMPDSLGSHRIGCQ